MDFRIDAEDVASSCVVTMLKQEIRCSGLFALPHTPKDRLRNYLSQTIWIGTNSWCKQLRTSIDKEKYCTPAWDLSEVLPEALDKKAANVILGMDLKAAIQTVREEECKLYNLPEGVIPLDGVLENECVEAIEEVVPKRTWQRYCKQSRERLARELGRRT
jgi:hypothetical protein